MTQKMALCFKAEDLNTLGEIHTDAKKQINVSFVDREVCEHSKNGWIQIIPYVSITTLIETDKGYKLAIVNYKRPTSGGEDRLHEKRSVGYGGHIDSMDDVPAKLRNKFTDVDGVKQASLTNDELHQIVRVAATRELLEETGSEELVKYADNMAFTFWLGDQTVDVNKVHLAASATIVLPANVFIEITSTMKANREISDISTLTIDLETVIMQFDLSGVLKNLVKELEVLKYEEWSLHSVSRILSKYYYGFLQNVKFTDIVAINNLTVQKTPKSKTSKLKVNKDNIKNLEIGDTPAGLPKPRKPRAKKVVVK